MKNKLVMKTKKNNRGCCGRPRLSTTKDSNGNWIRKCENCGATADANNIKRLMFTLTLGFIN